MNALQMQCPKCELYGFEWDGRAKKFVCPYKSCNYTSRHCRVTADTVGPMCREVRWRSMEKDAPEEGIPVLAFTEGYEVGDPMRIRIMDSRTAKLGGCVVLWAEVSDIDPELGGHT